MRPPCILTLDIGTSSVRAVLFDREGNTTPAYQAAIPHTVRTTADGGAELDADTMIAHALQCAAQVCRNAAGLSIAAVAVCTFWHSVLGLNRRGEAITPIYLWADTRSRQEVHLLRDQLDERQVHQRTGCVFHTSYLPARLLWLRRTHPTLFQRVARWASVGEYLELKLFGQSRCSFSMASGTGLFHTHRLDWDDEMLAVAGISRSQLSPLVDFNAPLHGLKGDHAAQLPALATIPWFPAVGDGACSNIGSGCVDEGRVALMVGTSGAMRVLYERREAIPAWGVWCYRVDSRRLLMGGALSNGGNLIAWLRETLRLPDGDALERAISEQEPTKHGLVFLPFLAGERSPGWASDATGTLHGLQWHTRPLDIYRAGLEAVALRFRLIHELLQSVLTGEEAIIATGGALLRSPAWMQIMADALGRPVIASQETEASSRGAALLALEALGLLGHLREAPIRLGARYHPRPEHYALYAQAVQRQQRLYRMLLDVERWHVER